MKGVDADDFFRSGVRRNLHDLGHASHRCQQGLVDCRDRRVVVLAGVVVIVGRYWLEGSKRQPSGTAAAQPGTEAPAETGDSTLVRSWSAISLVGGLLDLRRAVVLD